MLICACYWNFHFRKQIEKLRHDGNNASYTNANNSTTTYVRPSNLILFNHFFPIFEAFASGNVQYLEQQRANGSFGQQQRNQSKYIRKIVFISFFYNKKNGFATIKCLLNFAFVTLKHLS